MGILGFMLAGVVVLLIPFVHRDKYDAKQNRIFMALGIAAIVYLIVLTYLGYTANPSG